jgi:hypothetical protein
MERETRIELATNSLEGCDSTIELLPQLASDNSIVRNVRPGCQEVSGGDGFEEIAVRLKAEFAVDADCGVVVGSYI